MAVYTSHTKSLLTCISTCKSMSSMDRNEMDAHLNPDDEYAR